MNIIEFLNNRYDRLEQTKNKGDEYDKLMNLGARKELFGIIMYIKLLGDGKKAKDNSRT